MQGRDDGFNGNVGRGSTFERPFSRALERRSPFKCSNASCSAGTRPSQPLTINDQWVPIATWSLQDVSRCDSGSSSTTSRRSRAPYALLACTLSASGYNKQIQTPAAAPCGLTATSLVWQLQTLMLVVNSVYLRLTAWQLAIGGVYYSNVLRRRKQPCV